MNMLLHAAALALIPFLAAALLPNRQLLGLVGGTTLLGLLLTMLWLADAQDVVVPAFFAATLVAAGLLTGVATGYARLALADRQASWDRHLVAMAAGAVGCVPAWLALAGGTLFGLPYLGLLA